MAGFDDAEGEDLVGRLASILLGHDQSKSAIGLNPAMSKWRVAFEAGFSRSRSPTVRTSISQGLFGNREAVGARLSAGERHFVAASLEIWMPSGKIAFGLTEEPSSTRVGRSRATRQRGAAQRALPPNEGIHP